MPTLIKVNSIGSPDLGRALGEKESIKVITLFKFFGVPRQLCLSQLTDLLEKTEKRLRFKIYTLKKCIKYTD